MLSERDLRILAEIERELWATDPGLVNRFRYVRLGGTGSSHGGPAGACSTDWCGGCRKDTSSPRLWQYVLAVLGPLLLVIASAFSFAPVLILCCLLLGAGLEIRARRRGKRRSG